MGRSQKWPDLRSPISKIRDIRFVGTDDLIIFQKFHNFPWNIVAVAPSESYFVVGSLDLTWWPDLTWPWVEIFTKVAEKMGVRWVKTRRRCAPPYFRYPRKTWGGAFKHPPSRARVKGSVSTAFAVWKYFSWIKKQFILCFDETKMDLKPLIMLFKPILFLPYRLWWPNCWAEKWFKLAHVIQTNFEGVSFLQTDQLANSRDAISRHLYYKVFK